MTTHKIDFGSLIVAQTKLSLIDGEGGRLFFRGYNIEELKCHLKFENILYLLLYGVLLSHQEEEQFRCCFAQNRSLSALAKSVLNCMPCNARPIDVLSTVFAAESSILYSMQSEIEQGLSCIAVAPTIVATFHRLRNNLAPIEPDKKLGHAENFLYMLSGRRPNEASTIALNTYMALMAEHALNASTLNARVIASTGSGYHQAIIGSISALQGELHGGAVTLVLEQIEQALHSSSIKEWGIKKIENGIRLSGFGHPLYTKYDPRSEVLRKIVKQLDFKMYTQAEYIENEIHNLLKELKPDKSMSTNVEYYSALLLQAIGFPRDLFITAFASARMAGWCSHIFEQREQQKAGIIGVMHPISLYIGNIHKL